MARNMTEGRCSACAWEAESQKEPLSYSGHKKKLDNFKAMITEVQERAKVLTQGSNPGLLHCRQILHYLNHQGSPGHRANVRWALVAQSCPTLYDLMDCSPPGSSVHGDSLGKYTGVGCQGLLQGIFSTQVFCISGGFFMVWAARDAQECWSG